MAKKQSRARARTAAGVQPGKRGVKKEGSKLKDLDAKSDRKIGGGGKAGGTFEIKDYGFNP
jgi:hypothetical protein